MLDTIQVMTDINNLVNHKEVNEDNFNFIKTTGVGYKFENERAFKVQAINLNRFQTKYNAILSLSQCKKVSDKIIELIGVIDNEIVDLKRIDIAIDSNIDFKEEFKFLLFFFELVKYRDKKSDKWYTINLNTLENNSIIQKGRSIEICFYDENEESNGRHLMKTRMEWRFKRISPKDYYLHFNKVIDNINNIENTIEHLKKIWQIGQLGYGIRKK